MRSAGLALVVATLFVCLTPGGSAGAAILTPPNVLEISVGTDQVRNVPFPVTVTARDAAGNVIDDSTTVITFTGTVPAFDPPQFTPVTAMLVNGQACAECGHRAGKWAPQGSSSRRSPWAR